MLFRTNSVQKLLKNFRFEKSMKPMFVKIFNTFPSCYFKCQYLKNAMSYRNGTPINGKLRELPFQGYAYLFCSLLGPRDIRNFVVLMLFKNFILGPPA